MILRRYVSSTRLLLRDKITTCMPICNQIQIRSMRLYRERTVRLMYWRGRSFDAVKFPERSRDARPNWNYRSEIYAFSRRLQENLSQDTLRTIFCQKSYATKMDSEKEKFGLPDMLLESNEQLVARGRPILIDCLKPYLRFTFPRLPEDGIQAITEYLSSQSVASDIAKWIGCKDLILTTDWPPSDDVLADTLFALLAGIELDLGVQRVRRFVVDMIVTYIHDKNVLDEIWNVPNPGETLQLILKNSGLPPYEPRIIFQTGVKTLESCHIVGLYVNRILIGKGPGETLPIAEESASIDALERIFDLKSSRHPFVCGEASEQINLEAFRKPNHFLDSWKFKPSEYI